MGIESDVKDVYERVVQMERTLLLMQPLENILRINDAISIRSVMEAHLPLARVGTFRVQSDWPDETVFIVEPNWHECSIIHDEVHVLVARLREMGMRISCVVGAR